MTSAGRLLISTPNLLDPNFVHTVVLMIEHDDGAGALGVVLNRPTIVPLADTIPGWTDLSAHTEVLFSGGPVESQVAVALGRTRPGVEASIEAAVIGGLEIVDLDSDTVLAAARYDDVRVFSGYSGWGPGQLEFELDEGAWFVVDAEIDDVFTDEPDELWRRVLGRQPGPLGGLRHFPDDPNLN